MNEGCDTEELEVTATSSEELRTQAEGAKKQNRQEKAASSGGAEKDPEPEDGAKARGRAARGRGRGRPTTWVYRIAACALASPREARMRQKQHSGASSKPQSRHPRPRPWPEGKGSLFCSTLLRAARSRSRAWASTRMRQSAASAAYCIAPHPVLRRLGRHGLRRVRRLSLCAPRSPGAKSAGARPAAAPAASPPSRVGAWWNEHAASGAAHSTGVPGLSYCIHSNQLRQHQPHHFEPGRLHLRRFLLVRLHQIRADFLQLRHCRLELPLGVCNDLLLLSSE